MNIAQIRAKYPQYSDLSDKQLADALHSKFYSDLPIQDYYKRIGFAPEPAAVSKIKSFLPAPVADVLHQVADVPIGFQKGITRGIRAVSDIFGANNAFSRSLKQNEEALADLMSAQAKNDQQEIARILKEAEDKGVLDQIKAGVKAFTVAPVDTLTSAFGTAAPAIVAALGAKVLGAGALLTTGVSVATGAGMGTGTIKGTIYEETKKALEEAGVPESIAEERAKKAQEYGGQNLDQIIAGAVIGGVAAKGPLEKGAVRAIASRISKNVAAREAAESVPEKAVKGATTGRIRAGVAEALPEAGQAAQEQIAANIAQQREGLDVPTFRGAVAAGTMEGLAGAGLGAMFGGERARGAVAPPPGAPAGEIPIERAERLAAEKAPPPAPPAAETPAPPTPPAPPVAEEPPAPETPAPPIQEPTVRKKGEPPATGLQPDAITELGISKKQPIFRRMLGKDMDDPAQRDAVLADIEDYLTKGLGSEESRTKLTAFKEQFAPPAAETPTPPAAEAAPSAITAPANTSLTFETAKGSQYSVFDDGTTQRNKAPRPEHPGDQGIKERTARTIYVDGDASRLSAAGVENMEGARVIIDDDGTASLVWKNPKTGRLGSSPASSKIKFYNEPAIGRSPLELWSRTEVAGREGYSGMHAGNKIVKITPVLTETPSVTPSTTESAASGAGAPVVGEPGAGATPGGAGVTEPTGVVPAVADAGQPIAGEGAKPSAVKQRQATISFRTPESGIVSNESVLGTLRRIEEDDDIALEYPDREGAIMLTGIDRQAGGQKGRASDVLKTLVDWADKNNERIVLMPAASGDLKQPELIKWYERNGFVQKADGAMERAPNPAAAAPAPKEPAKPAVPTFTEAEIEDALAANLITSEQAERAREELRAEEPPSTAMGAAFQKQIDNIKAQMDALRQKNGKPPAKKSPAREKYDALAAQLDTLLPAGTGTLEERLEKAQATGVFTAAGSKPVVDFDALRDALVKARAEPKMYKAVLTYIGVNEDGTYLPTTYTADEAAKSVGLAASSGANVRRIANQLGLTADVISRFHAGQTDVIVTGKNVSEAGTGLTDVQPKRGVLYEPATKREPAKAAAFLRAALTADGKLDFSALTDRQVAEMYARASNFDPKRETNIEVIKQLNNEIDVRTKKDRKSMQQALDSAYRVVRAEEETAAEETETVELPEEVEAEDRTLRLSDEEAQYRSIPQSPVVTNRASHAELEKVVGDIGKALGGQVDVIILDDVTDVDASQQPGTRAGALIKGQIYLFRSGIAKGIEGQKTIFHELFHKGLKNLLPDAEYQALMSKFYNQSAEIRAMADAYLASDVGKKDTKGLSPQGARALAVEESLADIAEQTKLKPALVRQVSNFLARIADRFGMPQLARAIRTMGLNEQEKFIRQALEAGLGPTTGEGVTRFRAGENEVIKLIGQLGPIKNASIFYWSDKTGVAFQLFDQDLIDSGVKPSRAVVDQFDLDISKDGKTAEIHTHGVPPGSSAVLSKYKDQISRVKPIGFSGDPYYKFDPGAFSNKEIRQLIRSLRDIAVQEGSFDKVETVRIKRATGATAGRAPREISREAAMRFRTVVTPEAEATAKELKAIGEKEETSLSQQVGRQLAGNKALRLREKFTDSLAPLEDFFVNAYGGQIRTAGGRLNPMVLLSRAIDALRVSKTVQQEGGLDRQDGLLVAAELKDADGRSVSYSGVLKRIADAAKAEGKTYEEYRNVIDNILYGHREYNLREKNKELPTDEQVDLFLDDAQIDRAEAAFQADPFIKQISADLDTIRFNLLDTLVDTGRISPERAQEYKDATGYLPFQRLGDYENKWDQSRVGKNRGAAALKEIRRLEGSKRQSASVIENFSGLVDWATSEAMKNEAASRALDDMLLMGAAKRGGKPATDSPGGVVEVYKDGVKRQFYVPDPAHLVAFSIADPQLSAVFKAMQRGSQLLRAGVTAMPPFAIKQVFDDVVRAYTYAGVKNNAELVKNVLTNFPKNWFNEIFKRKADSIRDMERLGIVGTFDFTQQTNLKNILTEAGAKKEGLGSAILRVMEAGAKASDLAVRQAIYKQVLKETGDTAQAESAAREIINFSRRGSSKLMGIMISVIPFFNAYARGMDKLATAAAGKAVGQTTGTARSMFYKRMMVLTAMGFTYALMMQDDEEYEKLPDHVRDTNWVLPYGKELGFVPVIPVPPELAFFFKAIPERIVRYMKYQGTPEEQTAMSVLGDLTKRGIDVFSSPNITPQVLRPVLENIANYSFFLGRPLESQAQLALRPFERYGTGTSDAMKAVARGLEDVANATGIESFAISPIKLENLVRGLMGTGAGIALSLADAAVNPSRTDRPLHQQLTPQLTGASALMKNAVGTRFMDEIYSLEKRTEQVYGTYNRLLKTDPAGAEQFVKDNIGMYAIRDSVQAVMDAIRTLNEAAMTIDRDTSLSPEERRKRIDELRAEQNEIARVVFSLRNQARAIQAEQ